MSLGRDGSGDPPHVTVAGGRAFVKKIEEIPFYLVDLDEIRNDEAGRTALSIQPYRIGLPKIGLALDEKDPAEDVETGGFHQMPDYLHHCFSHGMPSLFPSIFVPGQFLRKNVASVHEVICEHIVRPSHLNPETFGASAQLLVLAGDPDDNAFPLIKPCRLRLS